MSILLIDPDVGSDIAVRQCFDELGFENMDIVRSVEQARDFLRHKAETALADGINLIIINSQLDQIDGYELCREIRKSEQGKKAYIIILVSSVKNTVAIEKARYCGANDFSVKPYHGAEFRRHLLIFSHKRTVLLVEDDPAVSKLVSTILYKKNVEVVGVDDGLRAYNLINTIAPPKLVLLDIGLPNMSGLKLVKHIRSKTLWRNTPVIMLTASTSVSDVKESLSCGATEYIIKPVQIPAFSDRIAPYFQEVVD